MEYKELMLDMLNRIVKLEKEVELLKAREHKETSPSIDKSGAGNAPQQRDKTRYLFNGDVYLKNKLVLAVVKEYILRNPGITCGELKAAFNRSLQGSIGVVEYEEIAKRRNEYTVRFFAGEGDILRLVDGNMFVCSQWGISNISNFIKRAEELGFIIQAIEIQQKEDGEEMDAQAARDAFWTCFDEYVEANGNKFFVTHMKGGKNQAAGNINNMNPMAMKTLCCEYKYRENVILVQVYINHEIPLYERLKSKREEIEKEFGEDLEWVDIGERSAFVRRIQRKFPIVNKSFKEMVEIIYPYILKFIEVFSPYL